MEEGYRLFLSSLALLVDPILLAFWIILPTVGIKFIIIIIAKRLGFDYFSTRLQLLES